MPEPTIYHNPNCSKSRQTLALLTSKGFTPHIIHYLEEVPSTDELQQIFAKLNMSPRNCVRKKEALYKEHITGKEDQLSDQDLIALMVQYPKLIERPIVIYNDKAAIGRPPKNILDIL